jgi:hypothetical protein
VDFTFGLLNLKPAPDRPFDVVDLRADQVHQAHLVDDDLDPGDRELLIDLGRAVEVQIVGEAGAAAADDAQPQAHVGLDLLGVADLVDLGRRDRRELDQGVEPDGLVETGGWRRRRGVFAKQGSHGGPPADRKPNRTPGVPTPGAVGNLIAHRYPRAVATYADLLARHRAAVREVTPAEALWADGAPGDRRPRARRARRGHAARPRSRSRAASSRAASRRRCRIARRRWWCTAPAATRSVFAARSLAELGYTDVRSLAGGFAAWKAAGLPVGAWRRRAVRGAARALRPPPDPARGRRGRAAASCWRRGSR